MQKKRATFAFLTLLAAFLVPPAQAARIDGMYTATVGVADTGAEAREQAIASALSQVLLRVTGSRAQQSRPEIVDLQERAGTFVQSFRYRRQDDQLLLSVTFDGQGLQNAVAGAGIPVWGAERPAVLVWIAVDYGRGRRAIVQADSEARVARDLRSAASERGLPVNFPLMDAQDRQRVSFADVWGGFTESVEAASTRYAADAILLGRARRLASGHMRVDWTLRFGMESIAERGSVADGVHMAADYFSRQFAVGGEQGPHNRVLLYVEDVGDLRTYARVLEHLDRLSVVAAVNVFEMTQDEVTFELDLLGTVEQLRRGLKLGSVLEQSHGQANLAPQPGLLRYRPLP